MFRFHLRSAAISGAYPLNYILGRRAVATKNLLAQNIANGLECRKFFKSVRFAQESKIRKEDTTKMKSVKGTQTEKNLLTSFAGESQARNRYTFFSSVAKKEGYVLVSDIFAETAQQEKEHAQRMFNFLEGGMLEITASYPAGMTGTTAENLVAAAAGEHGEWSHDYPHFADVAEQEGFKEIAIMYRMIAKAEKYHEERYLKLLERVKDGTMFKNGTPTKWRCRNCGYIHEGPGAPNKCPACDHPIDHFERFAETF